MGKRENIVEEIKNIERENQKAIEKAQRLSKEESRQIKAQRVFEKLKFEEFKEIIKDETYFKIDHFSKLDIDYDILIHVSAKNAGKTTELYRCIRDCLKRGEKFIYGRVTVSELHTEIEKFAVEKNSPVVMIEHKSRFYFYTKASIDRFIEENSTDVKEPTVSFTTLSKAGVDWVGLGMTFMNSNTLGAGTYEKFTTIFFDEIVSYQPREYVNEKILYNWGCAVSTILRNKKKLTIVMMGNLRNGVDSIPILDYYGIDISDDLRIIKRSIGETDDPCTILYVNSGSLYKSTLKNQASVAHHARLDDRLFQEHNKVINTSNRILKPLIAEKMRSVAAFAIEFDNEDIVLNLRSTTNDPKDYLLAVYPLTLTTSLDCPIYTVSLTLLNKYSILVPGEIEHIVDWIYMLCSNKKIYFDRIESLNIGVPCIEEVQKYYERQRNE